MDALVNQNKEGEAKESDVNKNNPMNKANFHLKISLGWIKQIPYLFIINLRPTTNKANNITIEAKERKKKCGFQPFVLEEDGGVHLKKRAPALIINLFPFGVILLLHIYGNANQAFISILNSTFINPSLTSFRGKKEPRKDHTLSISENSIWKVRGTMPW